MGRRIVERELFKIPLDEFLLRARLSREGDAPPARVPGDGDLSRVIGAAAPAALVQNVKHNHVLHERSVIMTICTDYSPYRDRVPA